MSSWILNSYLSTLLFDSLMIIYRTQYGSEDRDRADLLQNVLNHLNSESESSTSQIRSTSKDLSGILKNLKKIQTALEGMYVYFCVVATCLGKLYKQECVFKRIVF